MKVAVAVVCQIAGSDGGVSSGSAERQGAGYTWVVSGVGWPLGRRDACCLPIPIHHPLGSHMHLGGSVPRFCLLPTRAGRAERVSESDMNNSGALLYILRLFEASRAATGQRGECVYQRLGPALINPTDEAVRIQALTCIDKYLWQARWNAMQTKGRLVESRVSHLYITTLDRSWVHLGLSHLSIFDDNNDEAQRGEYRSVLVSIVTVCGCVFLPEGSGTSLGKRGDKVKCRACQPEREKRPSINERFDRCRDGQQRGWR